MPSPGGVKGSSIPYFIFAKGNFCPWKHMWKQQLSERTAEVVGQAVSEVVPAHTPHGPG